MQYQAIPDTDIRVSRVGLGTYALSGVYGPVDEPRFRKSVERALELGITLFDTAPAYGHAEEMLGRFLRHHRARVVIVTKVGADGNSRFNLSREGVIESCERSLRRLGTDYVDLLHVHFDDPTTPVVNTIQALDQLQQSGKIRTYGLSHLPLHRLRKYWTHGHPATHMVELSPVTPHPYQALRDEGVTQGIIAFSATGRGLLTGGITADSSFTAGDLRNVDPLFYRGRFKLALQVVETIASLARDGGMTPVQLGLAWVLSRPGVVTALVGCSQVHHLNENARAVEITIPPSMLDAVDRAVNQLEERYTRMLRSDVETILGGHRSVWNARDVLYLAEALVELHVVEEESVMPIVLEVLRVTEPSHEVIRAALGRLGDLWHSNAGA